MKVEINNIIKFSNVDGPGNRMAIFFQGCNMKCLYCHNPETINKCNHCGICITKCPTSAISIFQENMIFNEKLCIQCDTCINICPNLSSPKTRFYTIDELFNEVNKIKNFIRGVTVSGGEATLNYIFLTEFFKKVKSLGLSTFVDSNGTLPLWEEKYKPFLEVTDYFMIDLKDYDSNSHLELTNFLLENTIKNIKFLNSQKKLFEIRSVIIPEKNNKKLVELGADLLGKNSEIFYKIIKYRPTGVKKSILSNKILPNYSPTDEYMENLKTLIISKKINNIIIL